MSRAAIRSIAPRRLVEKALADPDPNIRLTSIAVAADEGIERHARALASHVMSRPDDHEVVAAIRSAVRADTSVADDDQWVQALRHWAEVEPMIGPPSPAEDGDPERRRRVGSGWWTLAISIVDLALLAVLPLVIGGRSDAFTGTPQGSDAWGHISKIELLVRAFPHISWNPYWYAGLPHFEQSYPPLYHLTGALLVGMFGVTPERAVLVLAVASIVAATWALYLTVRLLTRRRLPALVAGVLFLSSPSLWAHVVQMGTYVRVFALGLFALSVLAAVGQARRPSRRRLALCVIALGATFLSHLLVALVASAAVGLVLFASPARRVGDRVRAAAAVGLPAAGLAAFFYVPFIVLPRPTTTPASVTRPASWRSLVLPPSRRDIEALPAALVALALLAAALVGLALFVSWRSTRSPRAGALRSWLSVPAWARATGPSPIGARTALATTIPPTTRELTAAGHRAMVGTASLAAACSLAGAAGVAFALAGHFGLGLYLYGIAPQNLYLYASWLLVVWSTVAIPLAAARANVLRRRIGDVVLVIAAGVSLAVVLTHMPSAPLRMPSARAPFMAAFPAEASGQHDFRVAAITDLQGDWIGARHDTPELRGYQNQGTVNTNWQFWAERAVWDTGLGAAERASTFDWYGVRWVYADPGSSRASEPFEADPGRFAPVAPAHDPTKIYRVAGSTPIAQATSARTALVIGGPENYDLVFRALAKAGTRSDELVTVRGGRWIDDFDDDQLRQFDTVVLYGARAHHPKLAGSRLERFVRQGGRLVIEAADDPAGDGQRPPVNPVGRVTERTVYYAWNFRPEPSPVFSGVDVQSFRRPSFDGQPVWLVKSAERTASWAKVVLRAGTEAVLATGQLGRGEVVWSGLNLPFYVAGSDGADEAHLLLNIIHPDAAATTPPGSTSTYVNAEHRRVRTTGGAKGVLVKETFADGWRATANGRSTRIYRAGPDFMYMPIGPGSTTVDLTYHQGPVELLGWLLTLGTAVGVAAFGLGVRLPARVRGAVVRVRRQTLGWFR